MTRNDQADASFAGRLAGLAARLRAAGCVFAEEEATLILGSAPDDEAVEALVASRLAGRPLEHLLGWADFGGVRVHVEDGIFVPRRRSELLVDLACSLGRPGGVVVDLCCGCGALGAAIRFRRPDLEVYAGDVDPAAVGCARRNLGEDRVFVGDLYAAVPEHLRGQVDVLVVNAPYVPTAEVPLMPREARDHEPLIALDGGQDGLEVHRRVAAEARSWLALGGHLLLETSRVQAPGTAKLVAEGGMEVTVCEDDDLDATAVHGRIAAEPGAQELDR